VGQTTAIIYFFYKLVSYEEERKRPVSLFSLLMKGERGEEGGGSLREKGNGPFPKRSIAFFVRGGGERNTNMGINPT